MISKSSIELNKLFNSFIANKSFSNKQHQVRSIHLRAAVFLLSPLLHPYRDNLGESPHERLVILHHASRVHQHHVNNAVPGMVDCSEGVTSCYQQHCELVLYQPEADLGQVGGLTNLVRKKLYFLILIGIQHIP